MWLSLENTPGGRREEKKGEGRDSDISIIIGGEGGGEMRVWGVRRDERVGGGEGR